MYTALDWRPSAGARFLSLAGVAPRRSERARMTTDILAGENAGTLDAGSSPTVSDTYGTTQTFESLGVTLALTKALANQGITTAFPIQALTIADALAGRDVCGKAKTGSGKTLAFGLPLLQRTEASLQASSDPPGQEARKTARPRAL